MLLRAGVCVFVVALLGGPMARTVVAGQAPAFVVPGKPGIPVIVNPLGFDASYQVVEGDFGLDRPAQVNPVIVGGPHVLPPPYFPGRYFPMEGRPHGYGRYEVAPRRRAQAESRPGQSYFRSWSAESDPLPATIDNPNPYPLNIDVGVGGGWWGPGRRPGPGPWPPGPGPRPRPRPGPHR